MYDFSDIDAAYRFVSSVFFPDGSKSELCKTERLQGRRIDDKHYEITLLEQPTYCLMERLRTILMK